MPIVDNINDWLESYTKNDLFSFIISFTIPTAYSEHILLKPNPFMLWNWWQKSFYILIKYNGDSKRKSSLKSLSFQFKNDTIRNYLFILILMHTTKRLCIKKLSYVHMPTSRVQEGNFNIYSTSFVLPLSFWYIIHVNDIWKNIQIQNTTKHWITPICD